MVNKHKTSVVHAHLRPKAPPKAASTSTCAPASSTYTPPRRLSDPCTSLGVKEWWPPLSTPTPGTAVVRWLGWGGRHASPMLRAPPLSTMSFRMISKRPRLIANGKTNENVFVFEDNRPLRHSIPVFQLEKKTGIAHFGQRHSDHVAALLSISPPFLLFSHSSHCCSIPPTPPHSFNSSISPQHTILQFFWLVSLHIVFLYTHAFSFGDVHMHWFRAF